LLREIRRTWLSQEKTLASAQQASIEAIGSSTDDALQEEFRRRFVALASVAHELKTPLAVMGGYTELLLSGGVGPLNDRQQLVLQEMLASGERLRKFVEDFLSFSAMQTGKLKMNLELGDVNAAVAEVSSVWAPQFAVKNVKLKVVPSFGLPPLVFDSPKLQHVVSNLLHNALKFTPENGCVEVGVEPFFWERRTDCVPPSGRERRSRNRATHNSVRIWVSDTGPGIAPEFHQEIFEDFRMLPYAKKISGAGIGLGLAIARRLVHAHGGKIWIESEPTQGSKFCFLVPVQPNVEGDR
jgi:signal transduction histidine kinase